MSRIEGPGGDVRVGVDRIGDGAVDKSHSRMVLPEPPVVAPSAPAGGVVDTELQQIVAATRSSGLTGDALRRQVLAELVRAELGPEVPVAVTERTVAAASSDPGLRRLVDAAIAATRT